MVTVGQKVRAGLVLALVSGALTTGCGGSTKTVTQAPATTTVTTSPPKAPPAKPKPKPPATTSTATTAPPATTQTQASPPPTPSEGIGSTSHAADAEFCSTHTCIGNFDSENGTIVQCSDGTYSHAGGISGACSDHGGEQ